MRKYVSYLLLLLVIAVLAACGSGTNDSEQENTEGGASETAGEFEFPNQIAISAYDVGSSGYAETSAVADAITTEFGTQIRLLPSGNGVGRMMLLRDQTAMFGRLGDENQFAYRGEEEFADRSWGPQNITTVWQSMTHMGAAVLDKPDIVKPEDLKGKRVPFLIAGSSINYKTEAFLAAGDLTWDDVQKVELAGYADQANALDQGQIDVATMLPGADALLEIAELRGIRWIELSPDENDEQWARIQTVVPWAVPDEWSLGAGLSEDNPAIFLSYPYAFNAYGDVDADLVYEFVKRVDATYDRYKDTTTSTFLIGKDFIKVEPLGIPIHEGTIRFLEEEGLWTEEMQAENDELIKYGEELSEAWGTVIDEANEENITDNDFPQFWLDRKAELVK